ncbi:MAG: hypothetical protein BWK79_18715 [Beggiatoa sp. IS2]|nr:MAG: hypothetical protein BWK79_18715 [Beggiatoa sp. IS2]
MATISGIASASLLATINTAAESASNDESLTRFFFLYITIFLFLYTERYALSKVAVAIEDAIRNVRIRVADKIRFSELRFIENTGYSTIYVRLTQDANLISQTAFLLVMAAQSIIVVIFSLFYIAWLSPISFIITVTFLSLGVFLYLGIEEQVEKDLHLTTQRETEFFDALNHVLSGFKELKINQRKSDSLFRHVEDISVETYKLKVKSSLQIVTTVMYSAMVSYLLLALIVFVMPELSKTYPEVVLKLTAAILFIIGPVGTIAGTLPTLIRTNVAVINIYNLEAEIDAEVRGTYKGQISQAPTNFEQIVLEEVTFHYTDEKGNNLFSISPTNLKIKQGETIFIVGGNGSGKSTLLKLLTGLYYPATGYIYLNDEPLDKTNYQDYRELFSIIFSDFHLFDRLYGVADFDERKLASLLKTMDLNKKTRYVENQFTNIALSTGQRKRLALIAALLEDKPIYVLDEWAADQDPSFRKYFYEVILEELKAQGKTIIAATHDDKYFNVADRVLKMDYGKIFSL